MKNIFKILVCLLIVSACSDDDNLLEDIAVRGGFIQFEEVPTLSINILELDTTTITEGLIDQNYNASRYSLTLYYDGLEVQDFVVINSFPATLDLSISDFTSALGITNEDISLSTKFTLVAIITTPTGIYSGFSPNYDSNNVNQGGNSTVRLKATGLRDAIEFDVTFFQPPAKIIRMTSFEEVVVGDDDATFTRDGGRNETADLVNGIDPSYVDYTAVGSSVTDEIGFDSEFVAVAGISSSSLGFRTERIGVTSTLEDFDAYPDGSKGFHQEDVDGMIKITFDTVEVPAGQNNSGISFQAFFRDTSWESKDGLHAFVNITTDSGNEVVEMVNIFDDDIEAVAGNWLTYNTGYLSGVRSYQLVIEASCGASAEDIYLDNVIVYEPED